MTDLIVVQKNAAWGRLKAIVLDSVSSPIYAPRLQHGSRRIPFLVDRTRAPPALFESRSERLARVPGSSPLGIFTDHYPHVGDSQTLSLPQAQQLLAEPGAGTKKGLRDRAILAILLGCGLPRSEVAALNFTHLQHSRRTAIASAVSVAFPRSTCATAS